MGTNIKQYRSAKRFGKSTLVYFISLLIIFFCLFPIFWLGLSSFKPREELFAVPVKYWSKNPTLQAYKEIFSGSEYAAQALPWYNYLLNSAIVAGTSTVILISLASLGGYGFSRFRFKGDKLILSVLIVTRMLPGPAIMLPVYIIINKIGLYNSLWGLILVHTIFGLPIAMWLCAGFINNIPVEVEEAAIVDGCSRMQAFFRVVLPMSWIGIVSVGIYHFVGSWSEFAFASVLLESQKIRTAPVGMSEFVFLFGSSNFNKVGAAAITMAVPITVLFLIFQRHFVRGFIAGSVKG